MFGLLKQRDDALLESVPCPAAWAAFCDAFAVADALLLMIPFEFARSPLVPIFTPIFTPPSDALLERGLILLSEPKANEPIQLSRR